MLDSVYDVDRHAASISSENLASSCPLLWGISSVGPLGLEAPVSAFVECSSV